MKKSIHTQIEINATPEKVWEILTDFEKYPIWNPFLLNIRGTAAKGMKLKVDIKPRGMKGMQLRPRILSFTPNQEFSWLGHLFIKGIFDGAHKFEISRAGDKIIFRHSETFSGILVPILGNQLYVNTKKGFEQMNQALKEFAESQQPNTFVPTFFSAHDV